MNKKEASARLKINKLLEEAGWHLIDTDERKANVAVESQVKIEETGDDFEHTKNGYIDYLLLGNDGHPIAVLEAKSEKIEPLNAKEQARNYAKSIHARYVILSNGNIHYLWDTKEGNPEPIIRFPAQQSLDEFKDYNPDPESLSNEDVTDGYIAQSQLPGYHNSQAWLAGGDKKINFIEKNKLKIMRPYQLAAIHAIQKAAEENKKRYLLEMATGTGKTLTCAAIIRLFLRTGNAKRILFLVDRIELEEQAQKAFHDVLGKDYTSVIYKKNKSDWKKAQIVVTTVQSLLVNNRYRDEFSPTDFELVISDEAHRSISGNARAVFEYFVGYRVGLTATPKDYLKGFDKSEPNNSQKEFERRLLMSTYSTFGCESGVPTFSFSLLDGVPDYLVSPVVVDARTKITTQLLGDKGLSIHKVTDEGIEIEGIFNDKHYEKKLFNDKTNQIFCSAFLNHADTDPISKEIGKTLIFAVSQNHAAKIVNTLNTMAHQKWPGKYNSDFAVQITSNATYAQKHTTQFTNNNLMGHTNWLDNYESSKTRVCVTVAMMTTGYDCPDLQNIVFMRPVYSPSDFVQMKGRGTRKCTFNYIDYNNDEKKYSIEKLSFKIIDFFAVCEYFNEKYDYSVKLSLPKKVEVPTTKGPGEGGDGGGEGPGPVPPPSGPVNIYEPDSMSKIGTIKIGAAGMRVDQEMFKSFVNEQQNNPELLKADSDDRNAAIQYLKENVFDKPSHFMNLEKISKLFKINRRLESDEALDLIMGRIDMPKTKQEMLDEKFDEIISLNNLEEKLGSDSELYRDSRSLFDAYVSSRDIQQAIDDKNITQLFTSTELTFDEYENVHNNGLDKPILNYVRDYINVEKMRL